MRPFQALIALRKAAVTWACALWLVVLATLPFTAPFATLDAADLFGGGCARTTATRFVAPTTATSASDPDDTDDAAASEAACQRVHPATLCARALIASPTTVGAPRPTVATRGNEAVALLPRHVDRLAVLRL
jgi:hypothetical protein